MKRPRKMLSPASRGLTACAKLALVFALFAPGLVSLHNLPLSREPAQTASVSPVIKATEAAPVEAAPVEAAPVEAAPVEAAPVEAAPVEAAPVEAAQVETTPADELVRIFTVIKSRRPDIGDAEARRVSEVILQESAKRHLDPMMILAVIQVESGFQYTSVSPMGARGIMQIMPDTGKYLTESVGHEYGIHPDSFQPETLDDPLVNIRLGVSYLHDLNKQFKDFSLALLAYNAGPGRVRTHLDQNLTFSDKYATLVFDAYDRLREPTPPSF